MLCRSLLVVPLITAAAGHTAGWQLSAWHGCHITDSMCRHQPGPACRLPPCPAWEPGRLQHTSSKQQTHMRLAIGKCVATLTHLTTSSGQPLGHSCRADAASLCHGFVIFDCASARVDFCAVTLALIAHKYAPLVAAVRGLPVLQWLASLELSQYASCMGAGTSSNTSSSIDRAWRGVWMQATSPQMQHPERLPPCGRGCAGTGDEPSSLLLHPRSEPQPLDWREQLLLWSSASCSCAASRRALLVASIRAA